MDTLSRKHRLRQQQQLQRAKEQQKYQQQQQQQQLELEYQVARKRQVASKQRRVEEAGDDDDEEEFRVYKVVEVVRGGERPPAAPSQGAEAKLQQAASIKRKTSSVGKLDNKSGAGGPNNGAAGNKRGSSGGRLWAAPAPNGHHFGPDDEDDDDEDDEDDEREEDEDEDEDDDIGGDDSGEEFAIQLSAPSCRLQSSRERRRPQHQQHQQHLKSYSHRCSTDSARSICDAGSSSSSGFLSSENSSSRGSRPHSMSTQGGGRLLDELDRLMGAAGKVGSPSDDSYLSLANESAAPATDSTLVRHRELDYSQVCRDEFSSFIELGPAPAGPVLVGVRADEPHQWGPERPGSPCSDLGKLLDAHLSRLECLLRLGRGDRSVGMEEAFGSLDDILAEVRPELRTRLEFGPLEQRPARQLEMSQQSETIELADAELGRLDERELERRRSVQVASGWRAVLAGATFQPPAGLELDWSRGGSQSSPADGLAAASDELAGESCESCESLERSLVQRLLAAEPAKEESKLVRSIVRRHMSDFLERYLEFQSELRASAEFARDWHQNWLFAWRPPGNEAVQSDDDDHQDQRAKRARLGPSPDLFRYSTLILSRPRFGRTRVSQPAGDSLEAHLEALYGAQGDLASELEAVERESRGQINLCNLLARDDTCDKENSSPGGGASRSPRRRLLVKYASSHVPSSRAHQFVAYGHLFESRLGGPTTRGAALEAQILDKLRDLLLRPRPPSLTPSSPQDRVHFTVHLTNVELVNRLPVVQFCAKIGGRLPVRVRWFRVGPLSNQSDEVEEEVEELSDPSRLPRHARRASLRGCRGPQSGRKWPLDMEASSELVYQNEWFSWFRFRRLHNELLFEIRDASLERDYGQVYRCLVENCCSRSECTFALTRAKAAESQKVDQNNNNNNSNKLALKKLKRDEDNNNNNKAILRTWSQRTLRQRAPDTAGAPASSETEEAARSSWQQTIDRRSSVLAAEAEDKFGHQFPYHPANLLKRLEENKFSPLKCRPVAKGRPPADGDFAEAHMAATLATADSLPPEQQQAKPPAGSAAEPEVEPPGEPGQLVGAPQPRLRLNRPAPQQVSRPSDRSPEAEPGRPKVAPKPRPAAAAAAAKDADADAAASVKSLISRFSAA